MNSSCSPVTSVSISPPSSSIAAGSPLTLTCQVYTVGIGTLTISWTGHTPRGAMTTQVNVPGMSTDTLTIDRASQMNPSVRCEASIGGSAMFATTTITVTGTHNNISKIEIIFCTFILTAPTVTTTLTTNGSPTIGRMLTITCNPAFPSSLDPTMESYVWRKDGQVVAGQTSNQLTTNPIQLADNNTAYTCESVITSPYLTGTIGDTSGMYQLIIIGKSLSNILLLFLRSQ